MNVTYITTLIEFKKTKFLAMEHDTERNGVWIYNLEEGKEVFIPINKVFSLRRGLETYIQKYYRRKKK